MSISSSSVKKSLALTLSKPITEFQNSVVGWFKKNARELPWRKTSDPYRIWISEIMLQQTQVSTVIPYYERFLKRFPTVQSLAETHEEEVLKYWEGLGYYRRGKNLRWGAKLIVEKFGGRFPNTRDELLSVPGIGPYSAGAILSIAFRMRAAALDGNLIRVYARYYCIRHFVTETKTLKNLWALAELHAPENSKMAREFTEGMMELGAVICTPRNPKCGECPVQTNCRGRLSGQAEELPRKALERPREKYMEAVSLLQRGTKIAFLPKGADSKYPDFMRLPFESLKRAPRESSVKQKFKYSVTHRDFEVFLVRELKPVQKVVWVDRSKLGDILLPAIDRKILKAADALL